MVLDDSSFGVDIWRAQYEPQDVQYDILQPESYLFTISRLEWMSPEFLDEALEIMKRQELQAARDKQEELRQKRLRPSDTRRRQPQPTRQPAERRGRDGMMIDGREAMTSRTPVREERTVEDVQKDFENLRLNENINLQSMRDPLLVWAHDDTATPGKTYQYRIRMGVFNPIAGKDWFQADQTDYKNQLVLWSDYSEPTAAVFIPKRIYVFPMGVVAGKDVSDDIEGVEVEVAKYYLGQWRDFDFDVVPGQVIGYEVEDVQEGNNARNVTDDYQLMAGEMGMGQDPEMIDFTSDLTLVDITREVVWGSRLRASTLYKMLYYDTEKKIQQVAIGKGNWDPDTRGIYTEIQASIAQGVEQRSPGMMPGGMPDEMMDEMMMMEMMME